MWLIVSQLATGIREVREQQEERELEFGRVRHHGMFSIEGSSRWRWKQVAVATMATTIVASVPIVNLKIERFPDRKLPRRASQQSMLLGKRKSLLTAESFADVFAEYSKADPKKWKVKTMTKEEFFQQYETIYLCQSSMTKFLGTK